MPCCGKEILPNFGSQSETGRIFNILLKHPKDAFISKENIDAQWEKLNYLSPPDYDKALEEYENFAQLLKNEVQEFYYLPQNDRTGLDSLYTHDPVIITKKGAILCTMGKAERQGEPGAISTVLADIGIPVLGAITGEGTLEGGDVVWLNEKTLAVGMGYRTNLEGIRQLQELTADFVDNFIVVTLPHWKGPDDCLHLMSMLSPVDDDLAVVYSPLMPVPFRQGLIEMGIKLIEVPEEEYDSMGCNILALAPRKCLMLSGNPLTKKKLEDEGVEVLEYEGKEISHKGAGGPTCLTRPLLRE
ncbi:MAG: amidinotransferase [bacterium]|nr:amidinotransferase [bacterium]